MKVNRYEKPKKLPNIVWHGHSSSVFFIDKTIFTVNLACINQNSGQLLQRGHQRSEKASVNSRSHFPSSVMVWAGITASDKAPLVFVGENVKINCKYYQDEILMKVVVPWASKHFGSQNWTFQQDWAPAHGAKTTVELCRQQFPDFSGKDILPSNSPDLNPMDFLSRTSYNNLYSLKGLPGLQAPPLYPPPPSYSQIQNFPELPSISNARLDNRTSSRNGKKSEITPVE
uniref:Ricin B-type lectin domain-containing protein n=1 Tax=Heterorhabditis bacteriophora TaxID=37862 RepID=A0A1I7XHS2_HETBA